MNGFDFSSCGFFPLQGVKGHSHEAPLCAKVFFFLTTNHLNQTFFLWLRDVVVDGTRALIMGRDAASMCAGSLSQLISTFLLHIYLPSEFEPWLLMSELLKLPIPNIHKSQGRLKSAEIFSNHNLAVHCEPLTLIQVSELSYPGLKEISFFVWNLRVLLIIASGAGATWSTTDLTAKLWNLASGHLLPGLQWTIKRAGNIHKWNWRSQKMRTMLHKYHCWATIQFPVLLAK